MHAVDAFSPLVWVMIAKIIIKEVHRLRALNDPGMSNLISKSICLTTTSHHPLGALMNREYGIWAMRRAWGLGKSEKLGRRADLIIGYETVEIEARTLIDEIDRVGMMMPTW